MKCLQELWQGTGADLLHLDTLNTLFWTPSRTGVIKDGALRLDAASLEDDKREFNGSWSTPSRVDAT